LDEYARTAARQRAGGPTVQLADVENFADTSKTVYLFTTEEVIYEQ
jgi:hypothetical protein